MRVPNANGFALQWNIDLSPYCTMHFPNVVLVIKPNANDVNMQCK